LLTYVSINNDILFLDITCQAVR